MLGGSTDLVVAGALADVEQPVADLDLLDLAVVDAVQDPLRTTPSTMSRVWAGEPPVSVGSTSRSAMA